MPEIVNVVGSSGPAAQAPDHRSHTANLHSPLGEERVVPILYYMQTRNFVINSSTSASVLCAWLAFAATLGSLAAEAPDTKAVEGAWTPIKAELAGQAWPDTVLKTISLKLHNGQYNVSVGGQPDKGTYTIEPSTKPKSMTITGTDGPNKDKTFLAIYELEGDTLRVCYDLPGKQRPEEFKTAAETKLYLVTYNRVKE